MFKATFVKFFRLIHESAIRFLPGDFIQCFHAVFGLRLWVTQGKSMPLASSYMGIEANGIARRHSKTSQHPLSLDEIEIKPFLLNS
jgi:hypothetical protein